MKFSTSKLRPAIRLSASALIFSQICGCYYSEESKLTGESSSIVREGYVEVCNFKDYGSSEVVLGCRSAMIKKVEGAKFYLSESTDFSDPKIFFAMDIEKKIALIEMSAKSFKYRAWPYSYAILSEVEPGKFMLYPIACPQTASISTKLAKHGTPEKNGSMDCNVSKFNKTQLKEYFSNLISSEWTTRSDEHVHPVRVDYRNTAANETPFRREAARRLIAPTADEAMPVLIDKVVENSRKNYARVETYGFGVIKLNHDAYDLTSTVVTHSIENFLCRSKGLIHSCSWMFKGTFVEFQLGFEFDRYDVSPVKQKADFIWTDDGLKAPNFKGTTIYNEVIKTKKSQSINSNDGSDTYIQRKKEIDRQIDQNYERMKERNRDKCGASHC